MAVPVIKIATLALAGAWLWPSSNARAVLFASTNDVNYNTTAPGGALTNSGWQLEGTWGSFLGTPIAPTFFLAAQHIGGSIGQAFTLNGFVYHTVTNYPDSATDLQIWKVDKTFPNYAPLFNGTNEPGQPCVVFGRGTERGSVVNADSRTNGWEWGASDGWERWGENNVADIVTDPRYGQLLSCTFDRNGGSNECDLSDGDSSGALFIPVGTTWQLAGINLGVDGPFSFDGTTNTLFDAALLDIGGLYVEDDSSGTNWSFIPVSTNDTPSAFYCTRVSDRLSWIYSVINFQPGPDLAISQINYLSGDAVVSFATTSNRVYEVDYSNDLAPGSWASLTNNLAGTGSLIGIHDVGACSLPKRFYRLMLVQ